MPAQARCARGIPESIRGSRLSVRPALSQWETQRGVKTWAPRPVGIWMEAGFDRHPHGYRHGGQPGDSDYGSDWNLCDCHDHHGGY